MVKYPIAEKFKSIQGEGMFTGTPMAFIRFVGCSVGKTVCTHCDTNFDKVYPIAGGGMYSVEELVEWVDGYQRVLLTGGEPLDRDLSLLIDALYDHRKYVHIETSGTVYPKWLANFWCKDLHLCVSPKPGYKRDMIELATEIKVILHGLGDGRGWPTLEDAVNWANEGRAVYIQPRNHFNAISDLSMQEAVAVVEENPNLRLSMQTHKWLMVR